MKMLCYGMDYYCPNCDKEMYATSVYSILKRGGRCPFCLTKLDAGEGIAWTTLEGKTLFSWEISQQHISNILYMLDKRKGVDTVREILENELASRGQMRLAYVPYYPKETEDKIMKENKNV